MNEPKENAESNILKDVMDAIEKLADLIDSHSPKIMSESKEPEIEDVMRKNQLPLIPSDFEKINNLKSVGNSFHSYLSELSITPNREMSIAKTKLEECVMWAVKGICNT